LGPQSHGVGPYSEGWLTSRKSALQSTRSTATCPALRGCPKILNSLSCVSIVQKLNHLVVRHFVYALSLALEKRQRLSEDGVMAYPLPQPLQIVLVLPRPPDNQRVTQQVTRDVATFLNFPK